MKLRNGDRIAVIGAGPAGTFFAYLAQDMARNLGLDVSITLFDGKHFERPGPPGCNMCAGVISETLSEKLHQVGLDPPGDRVQAYIEEYILRTPHYGISLYRRRRRFPICTVYRGNGPRGAAGAVNVSFDDFLLDRCRQQGIEVMPEMVHRIIRPERPEDPVILEYGADNRPFEAHLVAVASGLNTRLLNHLSGLGFGYRPPRTLYTCQAEIPLPEDFIRRKVGHTITAFALEHPYIRFAVFTPKRRHLTLSVVGKRDVHPRDLEEVLNHPQIREHFLEQPESLQYCFCRPLIAVSAARRVFTDRLVVVGDAAFSRYYKNGIESAFDTARLAAACAVEHGVSSRDFRRHYLNREARIIRHSPHYGEMIFRLYDVIFHSRRLSAVLMSLLARRPQSYSSRRMTQVLWSLFTGNIAYRAILRHLFHPRMQLRLTVEQALVIGRKLLTGREFPAVGDTVRREVEALGPLGFGQTVAIIGGGPAGVGCALALKKLSAERGIDLKVIIYEGKDFETRPHYNQCVGVLSPPLETILEQELGIPFPHHLVQRHIRGYTLHSDTGSLPLPDDGRVSFAVRRVTFDNYMLNQAREKGIEVIPSRVTDLEIGPDGVMIYSETVNRTADVVVGAFGLDDGTAKVFERITPYRQPRFMNSIVTKIHPGMETAARFEEVIHAFLPARRDIEFGAVTPKRDHLTINVAGSRITAQSLRDFLDLPEVRKVLPPRDLWEEDPVTCFKGKFPMRVARAFYGDRWVIIGDAAGLLRPFKGKGINTAILTGMRAAYTMFDMGISRQAFRNFHAKCEDITRDLPYGKLVRFLALRLAAWKILDPILDLAGRDRRVADALFNSVSAHQNYRVIVRDLADWRLLLRSAGAIIGHLTARLAGWTRRDRRRASGAPGATSGKP
ncbi:MAG: hypothetical protein C4524_04965 [Candidatus Zixiibacteriota bacterium]|nr:MAG: hypothetical protein C4524_04965 [candidate division Zixibacteria bacterium]